MPINFSTMQEYDVDVTLQIRVKSRGPSQAENLVMNLVDGPIFTAMLKRRKVAGVTYTMSADNPKAKLVGGPMRIVEVSATDAGASKDLDDIEEGDFDESEEMEEDE